ncbi:MAG: hypothetical protein B9S33_03845 [Pedosphaera sp. Tous-C6FEB]|nr:MAG: hypothetical protein B9S33_03845 [Pedosphaera sp. Tous-C6FEB]
MIQALWKRFVRGVALAALLALSGCSTFNRDWTAAAVNPNPANSLEGRWEGKWLSNHNGHTGRLRALVRKLDDGRYETRYHANYGFIFSFGMQANLDVKPAGGQWLFSGQEDLGKPYGVYRYEGKASATNFFSTYKASFDHGTFQMVRPK